MGLILSLGLGLAFAFVTTFLVTWAIREGGSFAFLTRSYWRKDSEDRH